MRWILPLFALIPLPAYAVGEGAQPPKAALGLALPKEGLSLWRLGPTSDVGLEVNGRVKEPNCTTNPFKPVATASLGTSSSTLRVSASVIGQIHLKQRRVGPLAFWRVRGNVSMGGRGNTTPWVDLMGGIGVAWMPWDNAGLWVRQGGYVSFISDTIWPGFDSPEIVTFFSW